jgi:hypothetical protein
MPQFVLIGKKNPLCGLPLRSNSGLISHTNDHQGHVVALGSAFGEG